MNLWPESNFGHVCAFGVLNSVLSHNVCGYVGIQVRQCLQQGQGCSEAPRHFHPSGVLRQKVRLPVSATRHLATEPTPVARLLSSSFQGCLQPDRACKYFLT